MSDQSGTPLHRRGGFTLVELLVVIGIIALLISILLPVLNKARDAANRTACISNQRSIIQAILMYANDNKQALPGPCIAAVNNPAFVNSRNPNSTAIVSMMDSWYDGSPQGYYYNRELSSMQFLQRYLESNYAGVPTAGASPATNTGTALNAATTKTVWRCPAAGNMWETASPASSGSSFLGKCLGYGYVVNNSKQVASTDPSFLFGSYSSGDTVAEKTPKRIPQIQAVVKSADNQTVTGFTRDSTKIWLICDVDGRNWGINASGATGISTGGTNDTLTIKNALAWQPVHNSGGPYVKGEAIPSNLGRNYGYLDGHVSYVPYGEWPAPIATSVN